MSKISVIVPVYNCEIYIEKCIQSVIKQTLTDFELLLIDDGSTDRSGSICDDYAKRDVRISVIHKTNGGGAGDARNKGLECARSPFVLFLDSDDWLQDTMLEKMWNASQTYNSDVVICGYRNIVSMDNAAYNFDVNYQTEVISGIQNVRQYFINHFPEGMLGYPWNKLYKRDIIRTNSLLFPKMRRLEDGIFNIDYFACVDKLCVIDDILYNYRASQQVEQRKLPKDFYNIMETFVKYYYGTLEQWGFNIKDVQNPIVFYFLNDFVGCLENIFYSPEFNNRKERLEMLYTLRHKQLVLYMLKQDCQVRRYTRLILNLFEKKHFKYMHIVIRIKIILKVRVNKMFQKIKKVLN